MAEAARMYRFPVEGCTDEEIIDFRNRHFAEYQAYRNKRMQRIVRNILYESGRQWIELDTSVMTDGARGFTFREMEQNLDVELPRPVTNHITSALDVEFATLAKRQWSPKIPTYSRDPRIEAAAKVAGEILKDRLKKLHWEDIRDRLIRNLICHGTAIVKSFWDESYFQTAWFAVPEPYGCPACQSIFASNRIPAAYTPMLERGEIPNAADFEDEDDESAMLSNCPVCAASSLARVELSEEASKGQDVFGRPLGSDMPKGGTNIEIITPFEYYPQNAGVFLTPETVKMHGICKVRTLDWVEEHYPHLAGKVEPESPEDLMRHHPIMGEWDFVGRFNEGYDSGMFDQHVRVYEMYQEPSYRYPNGRSVVVIGRGQDIIAENGALVRQLSDGKNEGNVPKVMIASAVWKPVDGEFWGRGLPDDLISPQNRVNGIDAQVIEARERMGSPNLMVPEDADLQGPDYRTGYGLGKLFRYNLSALNPSAKPEVFGSVLMPSGVYQERAACLQDMTKIIGPADIEIGEAPRNVTTTSGLQILGEQAERRRGTRERGITSMFQRVWEHQLMLLWILRVDTDSYEAITPDGQWEMKEYTRQAIAGQTKVTVEKQAYIEHSIIQRESVREAMVDGLYGPVTELSPLAKKKLLEMRGLPADINEDSNLQIDHAKRQWVDYVDDGKVPVIDPTMDNPRIRFEVLITYLMQDEGQQISNKAGWPKLLPLLAGWEEDFQRLSAADQQARQMYGGEPGEQQAAEMYAQFMASFAEAKAAWDQQVAMFKEQGAAMGMQPPGPEPTPPPQPSFLPMQPEHRVYVVWQSILKKFPQKYQQFLMELSQQSLEPVEVVVPRVEQFLKFRSVVEAYKLLSGGAGAPSAPPQPGQGEPPPAGAATQPGAADPGPPITPGTPPQPPTPPA